MSCVPFASPLDLQCIFVNMFSGTWIIFSLLLILLVIIMAAKFRMPNIILGAVLFLMAIMFRDQMLWLTIVMAVGGAIVIVIQLMQGLNK
jgi:hypothetical protein